MINDTLTIGFEMMQRLSPMYPVFEFLVQSTVYVTITALLIILFKFIFKNKIRAKWHVIIWLVLLVRFVVPVLPSSPFSIFNTAKVEDETITKMGYTVVENNNNISNVTAYNVEKGAVEDYYYGDEHSHERYEQNYSDSNTVRLVRLDIAIIVVWLVGAVLLLSYFIFVFTRYSKKLKKSRKTCDEVTSDLFALCKEKLNIKRDVEVYSADTTPILIGVVKPTIYLPVGYSETETEYMLMHELNHMKNLDVVWSAIATIILCFFWFNPVVWISFFIFKRDIEVYCDERTLRYTEDKQSYARLLLETATGRKSRFVLGTTSLQNGKADLKNRIKYMAKFRKPTIVTVLFALVLLSAILVVCLTNSLSSKVNFTLQNSINGCKIDLIIDRDIVGNNFRDGDSTGRFYSDLDVETIANSIVVDNLDKCSYEMVSENEALLRTNDENTPFVLISKKVQDESGNKLDNVVFMECLGSLFYINDKVRDEYLPNIEYGIYFPSYLIEEYRYNDFGKSFSVTGSSPFTQKIILRDDENNFQKLVDFYSEIYQVGSSEYEDGSGELFVSDVYAGLTLFRIFYNAEDRSVKITNTYQHFVRENAKNIVRRFESSVQRGDIEAAKSCFTTLAKEDKKCIENLTEDFNLAFGYVNKLDINSRFSVATLYYKYVDSGMIECIVNFEVEIIDGEFKITKTDLAQSLKEPLIRGEEIVSEGVIGEIDLSDIEDSGFWNEIANIIYADEETVILYGDCGLIVYDLVDKKIALRASVDYLRGLGYDFPYALASPDGTEVYIYETTDPGSEQLTDTMVGHIVTINVEDKTYKRDKLKNRSVFTGKSVKKELSVEEQELYGITWLSSSSLYVEVDDKIMFTQCTPDWSVKNLQLVICDKDTGEREILYIFK